jgi:4-hydroxybenzoyl-CoA thioesterase
VLIFVAKDADGRPTPIPPWTPVTRSDRKLADAAFERMESRAQIKRLMLDEVYSDDSAAPRTTLRFLVPPGVVNFGGKAHGGTVMRWIDEAAYACAVGWAGTEPLADHAIGVYSGGIHFLAPVRIGELVEVDARIILTSPHSMHISTRVSTADPRRPDELTLTTQCLSVFVVPDDGSVAMAVPQWRPTLPEDVRLQAHAQEIVRLRETIVPLAASLTLEP